MKDIKNYEGLYAITSCGKIWSYYKNNFLNPYDNGDGYLKVDLYKDGKKHSYRLHRLVADAYLPNPNRLPEVHHIDANKANNSVNNLQWITKKDNCDEMFTRKNFKLLRHCIEQLKKLGVSIDEIIKEVISCYRK